jgi:hypothetical protein
MMRFLSVTALVAFAAPAAFAQANLSSQGFGFPTGQLSTRALSTGGAVAEIDAFTQVNPATIALHPTRIVMFQIEPEFRTVKTNATSERTNLARYPNVFAAIPVGSNWVVSAGASTLLDRTSTTQFQTTQTITGGEQVPMTTNYRVDGAMSDVRLAAAWNARPWLRIGVGAHGVTGHNLVSITQAFTDTARFSSFNQSLVIGFSGAAASAGVQVASKAWTLGLSGRAGGKLTASVEDTVLSRAHVPSRFGATLAYTGIANSAIAVRASHDGWSALNGLGSTQAKGVDAWDTSLGADVAGPRMGNRVLFLRGGVRVRTLPFQAEGNDVTEQSITGGLGTTFANGRVITDFAAVYADRTAHIAASERAWTLSFGISIRP